MHKHSCPALDPYAYLLGNYGQCDCGGDDDGVLRLSEAYFVETTLSGFELVTRFSVYWDARRFAEAEARDIGSGIHIWVQRAAVVQQPASLPQLDYLERVA